MKYAQIRVFSGHGRKLAQADAAASQQGTVSVSVIPEAKHLQVIDRETDIRPQLQQGQRVKPVRVRRVRYRVSPLGNQIKAVTFSQVAGVKTALILLLPPEEGQMKSVDIAVMILNILSLPSRPEAEKNSIASPGSRTGRKSISRSISAGKTFLHQRT